MKDRQDTAINMMHAKCRLSTIKQRTGLRASSIRAIAREHAPKWLQWSEDQIAYEYQTVGCNKTMREWSLHSSSLQAILDAYGIKRKSSAWTGAHVKANKEHDVPNPRMTRAISMKWSPA